MSTHSFRKKYEEIFHVLQAYRSAVNEAAIVSITDLEGKIVYVNDKFIEISKYTSDELIGKTHSIINSGYHPRDFFRGMWQTISKGKHWRAEIKNKAKDGSFYWVDTVIAPVVNDQGRIFQYLSVRNLITLQKSHEEELIRIQNEIKKREQQLKDAQVVAKTGSWFMDTDGNKLEWSEETYNIFEIPTGTPMTYEAFLNMVHPVDRDVVDNNWRSGLKKGVYHVEHRILTKSGEKWVNERARFEFDESKHLLTALGTVQDITEKKRTEEILVESENLYKNLFNNSPFAIGIVDKETMQFLNVNKTAMKLYGYLREEFLALTAYDIRVPEEHEKLESLLSNGNYTSDKTIRTHRKKDGEIIQVEPSIKEMIYKGKPVFLITIRDVTEKLRIQEELNSAKLNRQKEIIEAQEQSRSEIGMELHDNINQLLVAADLYLKIVKPGSDKEQQLVDTSRKIIASANAEIRKLSASLTSPTLNNTSLKEAIEFFSENFKLNNIALELVISILESKISQGLKINIYRIIQEQFNNIIKYSGASRVKIVLRQSGDKITLEIADNGKGFNPDEKAKGIGLANIAYRAEAYNGKSNIETSIGNGCRIFVEFILQPGGQESN